MARTEARKKNQNFKQFVGRFRGVYIQYVYPDLYCFVMLSPPPKPPMHFGREGSIWIIGDIPNTFQYQRTKITKKVTKYMKKQDWSSINVYHRYYLLQVPHFQSFPSCLLLKKPLNKNSGRSFVPIQPMICSKENKKNASTYWKTTRTIFI